MGEDERNDHTASLLRDLEAVRRELNQTKDSLHASTSTLQPVRQQNLFIINVRVYNGQREEMYESRIEAYESQIGMLTTEVERQTGRIAELGM